MAEPTSKISRSKRGMRRSHSALKRQPVRNCPNCNAFVQPHHVCSSCGHYRGREVLSTPKS